jgi:hypothetical protein
VYIFLSHQGYAGVCNSDNKETISWARFEYADINDPALYPDYNEGSSTPPLLLVLGYTIGVQVNDFYINSKFAFTDSFSIIFHHVFNVTLSL